MSKDRSKISILLKKYYKSTQKWHCKGIPHLKPQSLSLCSSLEGDAYGDQGPCSSCVMCSWPGDKRAAWGEGTLVVAQKLPDSCWRGLPGCFNHKAIPLWTSMHLCPFVSSCTWKGTAGSWVGEVLLLDTTRGDLLCSRGLAACALVLGITWYAQVLWVLPTHWPGEGHTGTGVCALLPGGGLPFTPQAHHASSPRLFI